MAVAGITATARQLIKTGKMQSAGCRLWRRAREARGVNIDSLAVATHGYINSTSCEWMATLVTAAHHSIWRHLYDSMHATQKPKSKLKLGVGCGGERERPEVWTLTVWLLQHTVTSTVQAANGWQHWLWLPTTPYGGTCMTACMLHKSQKASSSLSRLTKKVTWSHCGHEKSF